MTENRSPYLNVPIPCPHCADGFVTAGDRHARTRQDVCQHCAGTGFAPAGTGETAATSAPPLPSPGDRVGIAFAQAVADIVEETLAAHPSVNAALEAAEQRAQSFYNLPEPARRFATAKWGQGWCENEAGSLAEFARLARSAPPPHEMSAGMDVLHGLDFLAALFRYWDEYNMRDREKEGLDTEKSTHVITVPPNWPTHGALRSWVAVLEEARDFVDEMRERARDE